MNSSHFEKQTNRIWSNEDLRNVRTIDQELIDRNILDESERFLSIDRQNVVLKQTKIETTEQIDRRSKKCNELRERLRKFTKTMGKSNAPADSRHCVEHQTLEPIEMSKLLHRITKTEVPVPDLDDVLKADEAAFQQHKSNIDKVNKLMGTVTGFKYAETPLTSVGTVEASITLLHEVRSYMLGGTTMSSASKCTSKLWE